MSGDGTARPRLGGRSLTARLVGGAVILVAVLVGVIGTATYYSLRQFLYNRLDQQVGQVAEGNSRGVEHCLLTGQCVGGLRSDPAPQDAWFVVLAKDGAPAFRVEYGFGIKPLALRSGDRRLVTSDPATIRTVRTTGGVKLLITARQVPAVVGSYVVVSGLATADVDNTLGRLVTIELIIGAAAVALALGATAWGVRRSLRNLYTVTGTAREVAAELSPTGAGLDRRVPVTEDGTEVGQLAESMNTLLGAVETQFAARVESEQRMRQFLADASHELRTPLTSIRGYAELARMQRRAGGGDAEDNLDRIESEGTRMSRLVDDLLLLARGDAAAADEAAPAASPQLVDLADVLADAVAGSRAAFADRHIDLETSTAPEVLGDRDQLLRVVRNLIANAAVHTAPGGPIKVCGTRDAATGQAVITVSDAGPGLPPQDAARVFERFWRADKARTRARGGSGLGMSIVAAVVRAHGGTVRFDSSVEGGSTVTVRLPTAHGATASA